MKRVIVHPVFQNIAFKDAEKKLAGMEQGECIVRPSSKVSRSKAPRDPDRTEWKNNHDMGPVVRNVDSAIHWIMVFLTTAERYKQQ